MGDDGASAIAASLCECTKIEELYLSSENFISGDGGTAIAKSLVGAVSLKTLHMHANTIDPESSSEIRSILIHLSIASLSL